MPITKRTATDDGRFMPLGKVQGIIQIELILLGMRYLLMLLCFCTIMLPAQNYRKCIYRGDSAFDAKNWSLAESYYSDALLQEQSPDAYKKRAIAREKTKDKCGAAGDWFAAALWYDKEAKARFTSAYGRKDTIIKCTRDSFSLKIKKGEITFRQSIGNGTILLYQLDTTFNQPKHFYITGKDTVEIATCPPADSVMKKVHAHLLKNINIHHMIERCGIGSSYSATTYVLADFDADGKLIRCFIRKSSGLPAIDEEVLRVIKSLPVLGTNDCSGKKTGYTLIIPARVGWQ